MEAGAMNAEKLGQWTFQFRVRRSRKVLIERAAWRCCTRQCPRWPNGNSGRLLSDPECAMAHWGIAMTEFKEIWDRPDAEALEAGPRR